VEPVDVAKEVIAVIDGGWATHVAMPFYARWIDYYNILPIGVQILVRRLVGVDRAMRTFIGRHGMQNGGLAKEL
jgi:hypothetical protein